MSIASELKRAERQKVIQRRQERANDRWTNNWDKRIFRECKKWIREEVLPLDGKKINKETITVKRIKGGFQLTTTGYGYDFERKLEFTTDIFHSRGRPADEAPEMDFRNTGIRIRWWRRTSQLGEDPMSDAVCLNPGATEWDREVKEKRREFKETVLSHIKRMVRLDE